MLVNVTRFFFLLKVSLEGNGPEQPSGDEEDVAGCESCSTRSDEVEYDSNVNDRIGDQPERGHGGPATNGFDSEFRHIRPEHCASFRYVGSFQPQTVGKNWICCIQNIDQRPGTEIETCQRTHTTTVAGSLHLFGSEWTDPQGTVPRTCFYHSEQPHSVHDRSATIRPKSNGSTEAQKQQKSE